jgi:hypothetical protein
MVTWAWPGQAAGYAYSPEQGRLAAIGTHENSVAFVDLAEAMDAKSPPRPRLVELTGTPTCITYKRLGQSGLFIIGQRDPNVIILLDAESLEEVRRLPTEFGSPEAISVATDPASPRALVRTDVNVFLELDLARQEMIREHPQSWASHAWLSPDGNRLYGAHRPIPDEVRVIDIKNGLAGVLDRSSPAQNGPAAIRNTPERPFAVGGLCVIGGTAKVGVGRQIYDEQLKQVVAEVDFIPQAFSGTGPWAAGVADRSLAFASSTSGETQVSLPLPENWFPEPADPEAEKRARVHNPVTTSASVKTPLPVNVFADDAHQLWLVATGRNVLVVPGKTLGLPDLPKAPTAKGPPPEAIVGRPYEYSLGAPEAAARVELLKGPPGMTIDNGVLRWTPAIADVGPISVRWRAPRPGVSDESTLTINVLHRRMDPPLNAAGATLSPDGRRVLFWGAPDTPGPDSEPPGFGDSRVAVLMDIEKNTQIARREFEAPIYDASLSDSGAYVLVSPLGGNSGSPDASAVLKLKGTDLSTEKRLSTPDGRITCLGDQYLKFDGQHNSWIFNVADERVQYTIQSTPSFRIDPLSGLGKQMADGWLVAGVLWDPAFTKPLLLPEPFRYAGIPGPPSPFRGPGLSERFYQGFLYEVPLSSQRAGVPAGRQVLSAAFSCFHPCRMLLEQDDAKGLSLAVYDLEFQKRLGSVALTAIPPRSRSRDPQWTILAGATGIVVHSREATFVLPTDQLEFLPRSTFRIEPRQSPLVVDRGPIEVQYVADGATKFECFIPDLGEDKRPEKLESSDGRFKIDFAEIARRRITEYAAAAAREPRFKNPEHKRSPNRVVNRVIEHSQLEYARLTGTPTTDVPIAVEVVVRARASEEREAFLKHSYILLLKPEEFDPNP